MQRVTVFKVNSQQLQDVCTELQANCCEFLSKHYLAINGDLTTVKDISIQFLIQVSLNRFAQRVTKIKNHSM